MKFDVPINSTDLVVLIILLIFFVLGIRIVIGFFKTPKRNTKQGDGRSQSEDKEEEK